MNIADFIRSINAFDLLVLLLLFALFILGFIQGTIRRLLGLGSLLFSFLVAANLREPLGGFLASNWTHLPPVYSVMIGFGTVFVAMSLAFTLVIQAWYKKAPLWDKYGWADELIGGVLGVVQGLFILFAMIVILDSAFETGLARSQNELPLLREMHVAYDNSATARLFRDAIIPFVFGLLGPFIPDDLKALFPGGGTTPVA